MSDRGDKDKQQFERTLKHASEGYANARETIKFLDAKTNVIVGLLIASTALPFALLRWSAGIEKEIPAKYEIFTQAHPFISWMLQTGLIAGALVGGIGMIFATQSLKARSPAEWMRRFTKIKRKDFTVTSERAVTILFPYYSPTQKEYASSLFGSIIDTLPEKNILAEYQIQLLEVGRILHAKVHYNKCAVSFFQSQLTIYFITLLLSILLGAYGF